MFSGRSSKRTSVMITRFSQRLMASIT
jgi:hypothetical protein